MNTRRMFLSKIVGTVGLITLPKITSAVEVYHTQNWSFGVSITTDWKTIKNASKVVAKAVKHAWVHVFGRHPDEYAVFTVEGKRIVVIPFNQKAGGTRLTNNANINEAWKKPTPVRVFLADVPKGSDPRDCAFQQKYDEDWGSDPNIGPVMHHGDFVKDFNPGGGRYFAKRTNVVYWGASIVLIEDGLTPEQLKDVPGLKITLA